MRALTKNKHKIGREIKANYSDLASVLVSEIEDWQQEVNGNLEDAADTTIKESKKIIQELSKSTVTRRKGGAKHYRSMFTTRKPKKLKRVLWNKKYPLSHLLEDGHYVYNQFGGPYNINPDNSKYGTSGQITHHFDMWEDTEKQTSEYLMGYLLGKLK